MSTDKLPDGWTRVKFGDVVRKVNDRVDPDTAGIERYVAGEHMDTDDLTIRRWGEVGDGYLGPAFHMRFKPGHVLYGSRRTYLRKVAVADFEGITANTTFVLEPNSNDLLPEFLPLVMTTEAFHEHSIKQSKGSVNPYINFSDLTWYEFALPPVEEQRRSVEVLSLMDDVLRRSATVAQHAEVAVSSFVAQFDSCVRTVKLASVLSLLTKGTTPTSIGAGFSRSGVRFLKAENVIGGRIDHNVESFIDSATDALLSRSRLQAGDVLLTIAGTIGRSAVVDDSDLPANCNQAVAILRPSAEVDPWFLSAWLGGVGARRQIEQRMVSNTISNLSLGVIADLDFPVLTKEAQATAVSGILAARSVGQVARAHRESVMQMFDVIRSELLSGGTTDVQ